MLNGAFKRAALGLIDKPRRYRFLADRHVGSLRRALKRNVIIHICENMKIDDMLHAVEQATILLKSLASRNRLLLLCNLVEGEKSVGELARQIEARETAVSQQLALLRKDGLVRNRRQGQTVYYKLVSSEAAKVIETLHGIYCSPEEGAVAVAEQAVGRGSDVGPMDVKC